MAKYMTSKLEETNNLAIFLNECLKSIDTTMIFTYPRTFKVMQEEDNCQSRYLYSQCILFQDYATELVDRLEKIKATIEEYKVEYFSKWKFYALSKRLEFIKEYGGGEDDYDTNGNILTENITEEKLSHHSIVGNLFCDTWIDIVQDTEPKDLNEITLMITANASISPTDIFRQSFGKTILPSKIDENGNMIKMTPNDVEIQKALNKANAHDISATLCLLCGCVQYMYSEIKNLDIYKDNKTELNNIQSMAISLLDFRIDDITSKVEFCQFFDSLLKSE